MNPVTLDQSLRTVLVHGPDAIDQIGTHARRLGSRALLVTDPGVLKAGHVERARRSLQGAGVSADIFSAVPENPNSDDVDRCTGAARPVRPDVLVALGGGSAIDTAKGCNFLLSFGGVMRDYMGWNKAPAGRSMLPLVAVPTTAGTGSEVQSYALIADTATHRKMACGDQRACPHTAILDAGLTLTQPPRVTATAGIDAVAHAVETAVTRKRNDVSDRFARSAFLLTMSNLPLLIDHPDDLAARWGMLLGACHAGLAIEHSMLGAAHALANPLTARLGMVHGAAVGLMLPHVVRFNGSDAAAARVYHELGGSPQQLADRLQRLLASLGLPQRLDPSPDAALLRAMAEEAAVQWTASFNPRPLRPDDALALYRLVL